MDKQEYPLNVPKKLILEFECCGCKQRVLARKLGINPGHVNKLLVHGIEPSDKNIRKRLFLPARNMENVPGWVIQGTNILADLEKQAAHNSERLYNRRGKRVK